MHDLLLAESKVKKMVYFLVVNFIQLMICVAEFTFFEKDFISNMLLRLF